MAGEAKRPEIIGILRSTSL